MMSEHPPNDIVDKWQHCARRFGALYAARYLPEKTTPYMHVFVYHVGYFLKKLGNIECFANYDIESWHKINKRVKSFATVAFGGRTDPTKNSLGRQQLQYQHRTRYASTILNPAEKGQKNAKRKRDENEEDQNLRPTKQKGPNWTERQLQASNFRNPFFESVLNAPVEEGAIADVVVTNDNDNESCESELMPEESTVEMTLVQIRNNFVQLYSATLLDTQDENNEQTTNMVTSAENEPKNNTAQKIINELSNEEIAEMLTILGGFLKSIEDDTRVTEQHH
jgi:hypothetical protein